MQSVEIFMFSVFYVFVLFIGLNVPGLYESIFQDTRLFARLIDDKFFKKYLLDTGTVIASHDFKNPNVVNKFNEGEDDS